MMMVRRVRHNWITDFLEPSLAQAAHLALGLEHRPDTLDLGTRARRSPGRPPRPLPRGTPISEVFDQTGGGLLILGAPGAGKTTLLLQLAAVLLDRAEGDPAQKIPVVVNLASWARRRQPLAAWLVDALVDSYRIPAQRARDWVDADALVLLLDGLDEVAGAHRAACVEAINAYRRDHGFVPLVVCCRTQELQALGTGLPLEEAVELQPPTDAQIASYLDQLEASGTPLADVRASLDGDQELRALLRSPLLLHVVALAYRGRPAAALLAPGSLAERQARLWAAYMDRMFKQRPLDRGGYTPRRAVGWLAWLARRLGERDQTEFHLDRLDPGWLIGGLVFGLAGQLVGWWVGWPPTRELDWSEVRSELRLDRSPWVAVLAFMLLGVVFVLLTFWLLGRLVGRLPRDIAPGWGRLVGLLGGQVLGWAGALQAGLVGGLAFGLIFGMVGGVRDERTTPNEGIRRSGQHALGFGLPVALAIGLPAVAGTGLRGLAVGLGFGLLAGLVFGGGAWLHHYAVHAGLAIAGAAPWRYSAFLDAMTDRLLLRRSGSAYLFVHRLLRDHLAEFDRTPTAAQDTVGDHTDAHLKPTLAATIRMPKNANAVAFSPDSHRLALAIDRRTPRVFEVSSWREVLVVGYGGWLTSAYGVAFSPDGRWLATASHDCTAQVWQLGEGTDG